MSAQVIARSQWMEFARWITRRHQRWHVDAWLSVRAEPVRRLVENAPLQSMDIFLAARPAVLTPVTRSDPWVQALETSEADRACIDFAPDGRQLPRHEFVALARLRFFRSEGGETVEFESPRGAILTLQLRDPARTETGGFYDP